MEITSYNQIKSFTMNPVNSFHLLQKFHNNLELWPRNVLPKNLDKQYEKMLLISKNKSISIHASNT